jgi:beta-galactosidase/beta-glucuronidase
LKSRYLVDPFIYSEHPRPDWARRRWTSLDGRWLLEHKGHRSDVVVPFPIGSTASGVAWKPNGCFVYRKRFALGRKAGKRYFLHVGACDYRAEVTLNGEHLGTHTGGYTSFSYEITETVRNTDNELVIRAVDSRKKTQIRGKQSYKRNPFSVWYSGIAGLWQSVWIEETGQLYIRSCRITPAFRKRMLLFSFEVAGSLKDKPAGEHEPAVRLEASIRNERGRQFSFEVVNATGGGAIQKLLSFEQLDLRFWNPDDPALYAVTYTLRDHAGKILDTVESFFGLREITWNSNGICINGKAIYLRFVLAQGYYPGGVYAPLHYGVMDQDIRRVLDSGYNGIRIHQKIEDPYFHYLCDRHGLLTSYEIPSFYHYTRSAERQFRQELQEVYQRDGQHPSGIFWVLFNESWGMHKMFLKRSRARAFLLEMVALLKKLDGTRPVIDNSGWEHVSTDIVDVHHYLRSAEKARAFYRKLENQDQRILYSFSIIGVKLFYLFRQIGHKTRAVFLTNNGNEEAPWMVTEYGGFGWYRVSSGKSQLELIQEYTRDIVESEIFRGYCYTQLYDVEGETNGLLTFDRVPKLSTEALRAVNVLGKRRTPTGKGCRGKNREAERPHHGRRVRTDEQIQQ